MPEKKVKDLRKALKEDEIDNFPKGAIKTDHSFMTDRKYRDNEEMFKLSEEEIFPGLIITEHIKTLGQQCCRAVYHFDKKRLANVFKVHGEGIKIFNGSQGADPDFDIPEDPYFGWDMQNRTDGFPCIALLPDGKCSYHKTGKPHACSRFPFRETSLTVPVVKDKCSIRFEAGKFVGTCNGCGAF